MQQILCKKAVAPSILLFKRGRELRCCALNSVTVSAAPLGATPQSSGCGRCNEGGACPSRSRKEEIILAAFIHLGPAFAGRRRRVSDCATRQAERFGIAGRESYGIQEQTELIGGRLAARVRSAAILSRASSRCPRRRFRSAACEIGQR